MLAELHRFKWRVMKIEEVICAGLIDFVVSQVEAFLDVGGLVEGVDGEYFFPRAVATEEFPRRLGVLAVQAIGGVQRVELALKGCDEHTKVLERAQREPCFRIADMNV